jgi:hypothetical protein
MANLECVVAISGEQGIYKEEGGPFYYRARPEMIKILTAAGIDLLATANNHCGDYGSAALLEQGRWLNAVGLGFAGSGANFDAAFAPVIRSTGTLNVAVFSIDATQRTFASDQHRPGSAYLPPDDPALWQSIMIPRIAAAREHAHVVLVAVHWGDNYVEEPAKQQIRLGHALIRSGADAILGSSAHVLQGIEIYRGRPILYDAGNLLFDAMGSKQPDGGVFQLHLSESGVVKMVFIPVRLGFGFSEQRSGQEAVAATSRFAVKCAALGIKLVTMEDGSGTVHIEPSLRPSRKLIPAPLSRYDHKVLDEPWTLPPNWQVDEVPEDARIPSRQFGPLWLLGLRLRPTELTSRRMLYVESFWRAEERMEDNIRLDFRGIPVGPSSMEPWGEGMDHDPCDWLLPTSGWQPGVIYRDFYGLRPGYLPEWRNVDLQLAVGTISRKAIVEPLKLPHFVKLSIPGKGGWRKAHPGK